MIALQVSNEASKHIIDFSGDSRGLERALRLLLNWKALSILLRRS